MYKLLIVDDEKFEREGMANLIPWEKYGIELVGTAWNGVEGFEMIQKEVPDIVITDIKMPALDGIGLIRKTKETLEDVEFIVLSGYGEYEFTSQAMELGVRHYILKPCDEEKIAAVLSKVQEEVAVKREQKEVEKQYQSTVHKLLPRAREQVFTNMLLGREQINEEYQLFLNELGEEERTVVILAFRSQNSFDYLEQFILENILQELLGNSNILLSASVQQEVFFLLNAQVLEELEGAIRRIQKEFDKNGRKQICIAVSRIGRIGEIRNLYTQLNELFRAGELNGEKGILHYNVLNDVQNDARMLANYGRLNSVTDYEQVLFEVYLIFVKMELKGYSHSEKIELCEWIAKMLYGDDESIQLRNCEESWQLLLELVESIARKRGLLGDGKKEEEKMKRMLCAVYQYLREPEMSIQFLAKNVLFMNEDYFGRLFTRSRKEKFSSYLLNTRIALVKRLMEYDPELKMAQLAYLAGFAPDGQYFSKVFKKAEGMTPTEYRDLLMNQ